MFLPLFSVVLASMPAVLMGDTERLGGSAFLFGGGAAAVVGVVVAFSAVACAFARLALNLDVTLLSSFRGGGAPTLRCCCCFD